jgi:hypothetical protein
MSRRLTLVAVLLFAFVAQARDRAVLIYPKERTLVGRIFYTPHQRKLVERLADQYDVTVHQHVGTDEELFRIDVEGAKLLVISGHGDPFAIYLDGRKERTLDSTDKARLTRFLGRLDPTATVVLQSCHTGRGFAHLVKEAAGPLRRVIAARGEIPRNGVEITSVTPFDATITCGLRAAEQWDCTLRLR